MGWMDKYKGDGADAFRGTPLAFTADTSNQCRSGNHVSCPSNGSRRPLCDCDCHVNLSGIYANPAVVGGHK